MSINRVIISGNLTRAPELRTTASGMQVLNFGVAVNDRRRNQQTGEWEDYPNFIDCTMFGTRAESVFKYLAKGNKVAIEGRLHYSSWEKDGAKRSKLDVMVDQIEFMSQPHSQPSTQTTTSAPIPVNAPTSSPNPVQGQMPGMPEPTPSRSLYDADIPF